ncbi:hypothetical protein GPROT2_03087 [Gammaproteobacteria bacterium]|nr:hypothetical protein [Gammaproteobacteria bacterium]CAG0945206.1 hypothetical protein GPROT2_03087 [Gammaproteobacteria bacterium]
MKHEKLARLLVASLATLTLVATAAMADPANPASRAASAASPGGKPTVRQARVSGGGTVTLVDSRFTATQLSAMRPGYRELRPRVRGNVE